MTAPSADALLTFGVVALHKPRLPDLYVEGFVLLVLLVVDYFHLDGFTEEVGGGRGGKKRGGKREKTEIKGKRKKTERETEKEIRLSPEDDIKPEERGVSLML